MSSTATLGARTIQALFKVRSFVTGPSPIFTFAFQLIHNSMYLSTTVNIHSAFATHTPCMHTLHKLWNFGQRKAAGTSTSKVGSFESTDKQKCCATVFHQATTSNFLPFTSTNTLY